MIAHHVVFGVYGFWLPNDPRGSWSDFVGSWDLFRYGGKATKTTEACSVAAVPHDQEQRLATKRVLKRSPVRFNEQQILAVAEGFAEYSTRSGLVILACAILPDHAHLVFIEHRLDAHRLVVQLKSAATRQLTKSGLHPFQRETTPPKCFARGEWDVFLDTVEEVERAIQYVQLNPEKEGLPRQNWDFVTPYVR
ncbi:transposase [Bythopirellula goksoeyrii]|uniref:Transposase IS200-like domain-containing protein n=1 Tax=Bythopirellula goksoeyrii TaxID=1400387 RepID=A0A5B9QV39_9BACT|nr:transposase [Bythopirellula goksoeyrii]QEG37871.1 hypothetical protein Pr1d_52190 [Bythopirellula goksoeyrii]